MAIINRPRLRGVLVERGIADEPAAVEIAEIFAEEVEASQAEFVTQEEQNREVGRLEVALERAVERIEMRIDAQHSETRAYIAESHLRTVAIVLGGLAVATAILAIVIAVT